METVKPIWKTVSCDEFWDFVNNYPRELLKDWFLISTPAYLNFYDVALGRNARVASMKDEEPDCPPREYKIMVNHEEIFANLKEEEL